MNVKLSIDPATKKKWKQEQFEKLGTEKDREGSMNSWPTASVVALQ